VEQTHKDESIVAGPLTVTYDERHLRPEVKLRWELRESRLSLLAEEGVEDILLKPDSSLLAERRSVGSVRTETLSPPTAASPSVTAAAWCGTVLNHDHPILETELPLDSSSLEGVVDPLVRHPVSAIRLRSRKVFRLADDGAAGVLTGKEHVSNRVREQQYFVLAVRESMNILMLGAAGFGNITRLSAILEASAELTPFDRIMFDREHHRGTMPCPQQFRLTRSGRGYHARMLARFHAPETNCIVVGEARGAEAHIMETGDLVILVDPEPSVTVGRKVREILLVTGWNEWHYQVERFETRRL
jgi:type IV secretion system protein TrbB